MVRRYGQVLLELVEAGRSGDPSEIKPIAPPLTRDQQIGFKDLKRFFKKAAEAADIPVELVAPRKRLEKVMQDKTLADSPFSMAGALRFWRRK